MPSTRGAGSPGGTCCSATDAAAARGCASGAWSACRGRFSRHCAWSWRRTGGRARSRYAPPSTGASATATGRRRRRASTGCWIGSRARREVVRSCCAPACCGRASPWRLRRAPGSSAPRSRLARSGARAASLRSTWLAPLAPGRPFRWRKRLQSALGATRQSLTRVTLPLRLCKTPPCSRRCRPSTRSPGDGSGSGAAWTRTRARSATRCGCTRSACCRRSLRIRQGSTPGCPRAGGRRRISARCSGTRASPSRS